ncbi:hypothetical protein BKA70DRAFT_1373767 [Coprinopsis sp. MPI-PUGE-AT-0042]|nr:hypothetical protein BKA70DRAFT_1373767 [Coprinopsis sp. MPI-PUGE-AT-0042]
MEHVNNPTLSSSWQTQGPNLSRADGIVREQLSSASRTEQDAALYPSPPLSDGNSPAGHSSSSPSTVPAQHTIAIPLIPSLVVGPSNTTNRIISVSTTFCPPKKHDVIFSSADSVLFYIHTRTFRRVAPTAFSSVLLGITLGPVIALPESSAVLNVIFHTLYGMSCAQNSPLLDDLVQAVDCMPKYEIIPRALILPQSPLYVHLLSFAPLEPMIVYSLAGHHELSELAVHTSGHLLSFPLFKIDDTLAARMGPVYLRRLFMLHWTRLACLKEYLLQPPPHHLPTEYCTTEDQKKLTRAWTLAAAYLVWDARPDVSTYMINAAFESLIRSVSCNECQEASTARVRQVLTQWVAVKCTI